MSSKGIYLIKGSRLAAMKANTMQSGMLLRNFVANLGKVENKDQFICNQKRSQTEKNEKTSIQLSTCTLQTP